MAWEFLTENEYGLGINGLSIVDSNGNHQYSFPKRPGITNQSLVVDAIGNLRFASIDSVFVDSIGLEYTDLSVTQNAASGLTGSLTYNNTNGVFTYTPPDLTIYALSDSLSDVTVSGDYNDLLNLPVLFQGTYDSLEGKPSLATVATSGSYNDLTNKPAGFDGQYTSLTGLPTIPPAFPSGGIIMWSGNISNIPSGWVLCDGQNNTPDLRNRFVIGAGNTYTVGLTGGSKDAVAISHTHSLTDPGHSHEWPSDGQNIRWNAGGLYGGSFTAPKYGAGATTEASNTGITIASSGEDGTNKNMPPYYALAYIMKT